VISLVVSPDDRGADPLGEVPEVALSGPKQIDEQRMGLIRIDLEPPTVET
jgi:hypothetical protein